jgi:hypothetical protein
MAFRARPVYPWHAQPPSDADDPPMSADSGQTEAPAADCPLSARDETRNILLYAGNVGLVYVGAPVLYVGVQAALCEKLGASKTVSNLPSSLYFAMTLLPVFVAWYFCQVRLLKPVLVICYLTIALTGALVVTSLLAVPELVISAVVIHAALLGCILGVVATYQWELIGRGISEARRGQALGLAFGVGPILAFLSFLGSQLIVTGQVKIATFTVSVPALAYPWNYAALYALTVPIMALAAFFSSRFVVPLPAVEIARQPLGSGVFGGLREFFTYRLTLLAALAMILVGSGYIIITNIILYTKEATGFPAEDYVGVQGALRFGFKVGGGLVLGWLLTRTNPRMGLFVTGGFCLASVVWALSASGEWFLLSFGFMGVGELFGVYYPNYILCCSAKSQMRRNMSYNSMLNMPSAAAGQFYGSLADRVGIRASFWVSTGVLVATLLLVQFALPARPRPREEDPDDGAQPLTAAAEPEVLAGFDAGAAKKEEIHVQRDDPGH